VKAIDSLIKSLTITGLDVRDPIFKYYHELGGFSRTGGGGKDEKRCHPYKAGVRNLFGGSGVGFLFLKA
jgi:hypothetical protein